ncbi:metallophosphoesterase [Phenylobacterium sp.]|uniref:metallophosphoesterase n=1 Tax=Phenylobacterium sp. TaxID=1871053 RepID=UPI00356835CA
MMKLLAGLLASLTIAAAAPAQAQTPAQTQVQATWEHVARVVVIGDLHGDYGKFHDQLAQAALIDAHDNWSGGAAHLVQLGDVPDRAPDTRKILDLLIKLEPQARRAGGYVHALIGNHEAMNMEGDLRYTTPGEFAAFTDRDSARRRDAYYDRVVAALKAHPPAAGLPVFDDAYRAAFDADHPLGWVEHMAAWSADGAYGRWVLTHSAVIRIDDTLYLHAGLGPEFTAFDMETLDRAVLAALRHQPEAAGGPHDILWNEQGPLWYRGMAQNDEAAESGNVAAVLARYGVRRIVLGHTKRFSMVNARFEGAVILTDIAVKGGCPDPHAFLVKEGDVLTAVHRGHRLALGVSGPAHAAYLSEIAALDKAAGADPQCAVN